MLSGAGSALRMDGCDYLWCPDTLARAVNSGLTARPAPAEAPPCARPSPMPRPSASPVSGHPHPYHTCSRPPRPSIPEPSSSPIAKNRVDPAIRTRLGCRNLCCSWRYKYLASLPPFLCSWLTLFSIALKRCAARLARPGGKHLVPPRQTRRPRAPPPAPALPAVAVPFDQS